MEPFQNTFGDITSFEDAKEIGGYVKAMGHLYKYLANVTAFNPNKRMVDAVPILESISKVNDELANLMLDYEHKLKTYHDNESATKAG